MSEGEYLEKANVTKASPNIALWYNITTIQYRTIINTPWPCNQGQLFAGNLADMA